MIKEYLRKRGYRLPGSDWYSHIDQFLEWYEGDVKSFHHYNVYNGTTSVSVKRFGLNMAKTVCEDHADLLLNERIQISTNRSWQNRLQDILSANDFWVLGNRLVELSFALGTGAFVEYLGKGGVPVIDYIRANMIFPLSWDGNRITECAFGSLRHIGGKSVYYIQIHRIENGRYIIENVYIDKEQGKEIPPPEHVAPMVDTGSDVPLFQIVRPNIVNNIDLDCPMGLSVFGNAIDTLKATDLVYDSYVNEFNLGRKRIMVPMSMAQIQMTADSTIKPVFDPKDTVFYTYQQSEDGKSDLKEINMSIRASEHELGIQRQLDILSKKCGLGAGRYKFESGNVKTATEVISAESELYRKLKKNELVLESAIVDLCTALAFLDKQKSPPDVVVTFDDSIIEDKAAEQAQGIIDLTNGVMSKKRYMMKYQGLTEEQADEELEAIKTESAVDIPDVDDMFKSETASEDIDVEGAVDDANEAAGTTLNGAQTQSLISVIAQYQAGSLTIGQAINILAVAIGVTKDDAKNIIEGNA